MRQINTVEKINMKKIIYIALLFGVLLNGCKNIADKPSQTDANQPTNAAAYNYTYKSDNGEEIAVTFFSENGKQLVRINRVGKETLTLEQTTAWAKGAEYGTAATQWKSQGDSGILIENGTATTYTQKD